MAASSGVNFYAPPALPGCSRPRRTAPGAAARNARPSPALSGSSFPAPPEQSSAADRTMADTSAQDKNLPASQRKLDKARAEGQVARSRDLGHFAAIAAGSSLLVVAAPFVAVALKNALAAALQFDRRQALGDGAMVGRLAEGATHLGDGRGAVRPGDDADRRRRAACAMGGWTWTAKPLGPKFEHAQPAGRHRPGVLQAAADRRPEGEPAGAAARHHRRALAVAPRRCLLRRARACRCRRRSPRPPARCASGLVLILLALAVFAADRRAAAEVPARRAAEDEPPGAEAGAQGVRGQRRGQGQGPGADARDGQAPHDRRGAEGRPGGDEPDPLRGRAQVRRQDDGRAARRRQGRRPAGAAHPRRRQGQPGAGAQAPVLARALYAHAELDREIPAALFAAVAQVLAYVYQLRAALQRPGADAAARCRRSTCRPSSIRTHA